MGSPQERPPARNRRPRLPGGPPGAVLAATAVLALHAAAEALRRRSARHRDDGDVPGWVLVTLMTAGLVTALWVLARERLVEVFDRAITSVTGGTGGTG